MNHAIRTIRTADRQTHRAAEEGNDYRTLCGKLTTGIEIANSTATTCETCAFRERTTSNLFTEMPRMFSSTSLR